MSAVSWCSVVVGWISAVSWCSVVVVGRLCTMLLPQTLSFLVACCRTVTEVVVVSASPTFYSFILLILEGGMRMMSGIVDGKAFGG